MISPNELIFNQLPKVDFEVINRNLNPQKVNSIIKYLNFAIC